VGFRMGIFSGAVAGRVSLTFRSSKRAVGFNFAEDGICRAKFISYCYQSFYIYEAAALVVAYIVLLLWGHFPTRVVRIGVF
jgi:hypothetical protein